MLRGGFEPPFGFPILKGIVQFPRLGIQAPVEFLIDTGCDATTVMPGDARMMGLPWRQLRRGGTAVGIGGEVRELSERGVVAFPEPDGRIHIYRLNISIMPPSAELTDIPSLLGRDILNRWRMTYDPTFSELTFEVRSADRTLAARP